MDRGADVDARVLSLLRNLPGVLQAELVLPELRSELRGLMTPLAAENQGVEAVLSRQRIVCLFKGRSFRGPPEPSLLMVDEQGTVLGRELTSPQDRPAAGERQLAYLGRDFVLLRGVRPSGHVRFVLPPLRFPELERMDCICRVVSGSPDPPQDERLRERYSVKGGKDLASVLVGYDLIPKPEGERSGP